MMLMPSCFSAVCKPRKARPRSRARGLEKRETVRPETRPGKGMDVLVEWVSVVVLYVVMMIACD
jgi:hypothetical protein